MTKYTLKAEKRAIFGRKFNSLRKTGLLPGSVFGKTIESLPIQVSSKEFNSLFRNAGETNIVYLSVSGEDKDRPVLISNLQFNPVTGNPIHVDLHQVNLKEKVTASVPVKLEGESQLVKDGLAAINQSISEIEVEALPTEIPESIVFDISKLNNIGDQFTVADIKVTDGVEIKSDPEQLVVSLAEPQKEEIVETPAEEVVTEDEAKPAEAEPQQAEEPKAE